MNYTTASHADYFRNIDTALYRRPPGERSESTLSLSLEAALVLMLLYPAGVCCGLWLTLRGCPGEMFLSTKLG